MPITFSVHKSLGIVYARFHGHILLEDCLSSLQAYAQHPDYRPGQSQLVDMAGVTGYEKDFVRILEFFAQMPETGFVPGPEFLVVYYAPTQYGKELANIVMRSWDGIPGPVLRLVEDADKALAILGLHDVALQDLHVGAD